MARPLFSRGTARLARRVPVLRNLPVVKLIALAEVAMLARDHAARLTPQERRRLVELVRTGRGRRRNLSGAERSELSALVAKLEPRAFAGQAVSRLAPFPLASRGRS